jgi:phosphoribosylformimino-5-aminoimidazole carboxamide ribotide isomerase
VILYPAIDIRGGRAVRLVQGDYGRETAFDSDPAEAARRWGKQGARSLHIVDLDGAREGRPVHLEVVGRICSSVEPPVQLGGGLRDAAAVEEALSAGVARVVLGTALQRDPDLAGALTSRYGERIVAAVDARAGSVAVAGWAEQTGDSPAELLAALADRGVRRFLYTPVEVDGTLAGPGLEGLREVAQAAQDAGAELTYSGGVGSLADLREVAGLGLPALGGVVVGRALYEGRFTVAEGQAALDSD